MAIKKHDAIDDIMDEEEKANATPEEDLLTCKVTFDKPFRYLAETYDSMEFDFGSLTGADDIAAQAELRAHNIYAIIPSSVPDYLVIMAARACTNRTDGKRTVSTDTLKALPLRKYNIIIGKIRRFLLSQG